MVIHLRTWREGGPGVWTLFTKPLKALALEPQLYTKTIM